jgi:uncharacterized protein (DUF2141 family)
MTLLALGFQRTAALLGATVMLAAGGAWGEAAGAPIHVTVSEVWRAGGHVRVDVCTRETFLRGGCPYSASAPAEVGETTVTVPNVPPGLYAIQVYHDVNDNQRVDQGFMGIPKEGVGFSRDASVGRHGPSFDAAAVAHQAEPQSLRVRLRHFFHRKPSAPGQTPIGEAPG